MDGCKGCPRVALLEQQVEIQGEELDRERGERRDNEKTIFAKLDQVSDQVGNVWKTLLLAIIPLSTALLVAMLKQ